MGAELIGNTGVTKGDKWVRTVVENGDQVDPGWTDRRQVWLVGGGWG
jgi:hypothetical protein